MTEHAYEEDWEYDPEDEWEYEDDELDDFEDELEDYEDEDEPGLQDEIEEIKEYLAEQADPYGLEGLDFTDPETVEAVAAEALEDENHPFHEMTVEALGGDEDGVDAALAEEVAEIEGELGRELSDLELDAVAAGAEDEDELTPLESLSALDENLSDREVRREYSSLAWRVTVPPSPIRATTQPRSRRPRTRRLGSPWRSRTSTLTTGSLEGPTWRRA